MSITDSNGGSFFDDVELVVSEGKLGASKTISNNGFSLSDPRSVISSSLLGHSHFFNLNNHYEDEYATYSQIHVNSCSRFKSFHGDD